MQEYATYIKTLDNLLENISWGRGTLDDPAIDSHLNGGAALHLRTLVGPRKLKQSGAFFTHEHLGRELVDKTSKNVLADIPAWDPNCGAGDLLLRWSERLSVKKGGLRETLKYWGSKLTGIDIHPEFLLVAKRRLALAAIRRGATLKRGSLDIDELFPGLQCQDMLKHQIQIPDSAVIMMNPPFIMIDTPASCSSWSSGKVAFAAVAFLDCIRAAKPGQQILAILPDVLRSGSRYSRWRELVTGLISSAKIHIVGKFSEHADVDVFIIRGTVSVNTSSEIRWSDNEPQMNRLTLGDVCEVRVGSVVPFRHEHKGARVSFLTAASAPAWQELNTELPSIRHKGTCVNGPFVAVRRTSSPSDKSRAIATLVTTDKPVAVENHLITLRPNDGTVETCRKICDHLKSSRVRQWLDRRIRCRHLTVSVIREIPLTGAKDLNNENT